MSNEPIFLGDRVEAALTRIGVTKRLVSDLLGRQCRCDVAQHYLNELDRWARASAERPIEAARDSLGRIIGVVFRSRP
jgi:hypothetical protein